MAYDTHSEYYTTLDAKHSRSHIETAAKNKLLPVFNAN